MLSLDVGAKRGAELKRHVTFFTPITSILFGPKWPILGGGVCDLVHPQKYELSQRKHMGLTIYTKGNINLASYGQDHADVGAKGGKPVLGPT